ncbi:anti-sigma factor antagonist [Actinoplanes sp. NPDC051346]|uniref:anti-sigma factor antagonist n=1 Tax=Actinoplanes sp. NPDC051346 TaxID=3155048 RepID=UPI0034393A2A
MPVPPFAIVEHPADAGVACLSVRGEVDVESAEELQGVVARAARRPGVRNVVLDLRAVTFLDAMGVASLVRAALDAADRGVRLRTEGAGGIVRRVLEITGVSDWLDAASVGRRF